MSTDFQSRHRTAIAIDLRCNMLSPEHSALLSHVAIRIVHTYLAIIALVILIWRVFHSEFERVTTAEPGRGIHEPYAARWGTETKGRGTQGESREQSTVGDNWYCFLCRCFLVIEASSAVVSCLSLTLFILSFPSRSHFFLSADPLILLPGPNFPNNRVRSVHSYRDSLARSRPGTCIYLPSP